MVGLRLALRRIGQQGILNSRRELSKREGLENKLQLVAREYSSAGRGIGVWGACFDGGQPHEVLTFENRNLSFSFLYVREPERRQGCCEMQVYSGGFGRVDALSRTTATWSV